jgi:hypothetical protein
VEHLPLGRGHLAPVDDQGDFPAHADAPRV